jgi:hypothetical protein
MDADLIERRLKMVRLRSKGLSLAVVVQDLAAEYGKTPRTLYKDWQNRKNWIKPLLGIEDQEALFLDLLSNHYELRRMVLVEYLKAPEGSNARVGCLRLLRDINLDFEEWGIAYDLKSRIKALEEKAK